MANRILRDWTASEAIDLLSPEAEIFFTRLIMKADDYGSFYSNPKLIRSALFPLKDYKDATISKWVNECIEAKILFSYTVDGKEYLRIINFGQRLRNMRCTFPQPADNSPQLAADRGGSRPETKRNEVETKVKLNIHQVDFYSSPKEANEEMVKDELFIESAVRALQNAGWRTVTNLDISALIYHFTTGKAKLNEHRDNVKQHFRNWILSLDTSKLQTIAINVISRAERSQA